MNSCSQRQTRVHYWISSKVKYFEIFQNTSVSVEKKKKIENRYAVKTENPRIHQIEWILHFFYDYETTDFIDEKI